MTISNCYVSLIVAFDTKALILLFFIHAIYLFIYVLCYYLMCKDSLKNFFLLRMVLFYLGFSRNFRSMNSRVRRNLCLNEASCFYLKSLAFHKMKNHSFLRSKISCNLFMKIYALKSFSF